MITVSTSLPYYVGIFKKKPSHPTGKDSKMVILLQSFPKVSFKLP